MCSHDKNDILWDNLFYDKGHAFQLGIKASPCGYTHVRKDSSERKHSGGDITGCGGALHLVLVLMYSFYIFVGSRLNLSHLYNLEITSQYF